MTSPVLVTGGTGRLGRSVVARLVEAGQDVRVLARRQRDTEPQVTFFTGDLRQGDGIDAAVRGAGVIINCATSTKGDAEVTTNLVTAAAKFGSPHFVQPSIVGIDLMAQWGYVKTKLEVERIVENCGLPWTILRVTQFYNCCFENSRKLAKFPLVASAQTGGPRAGSRKQGRAQRRPAPTAGAHRRGQDLGPVPRRGAVGTPRWPRPRLTGQEGLVTQLTHPHRLSTSPDHPARTILTQEGARSCKLA
jgi:uncharacterized protein YbjT (DUF2867 family)